ncbi:MAG: hypothetical protein AAGD96_18075 [Chloroflexota bacterium]
MDLNFILIAVGISIAWIGLIIFYMRVTARQKELYRELEELDSLASLKFGNEEEKGEKSE